MYKYTITFFIVFIFNAAIGQQINIGKQISIHSEILQSDRELSVYLPPSYYENKIQKYPVLYILDGDYNFRYVTGLIELQSSISENIPEMIVIGISGKGTKEYRKNCKPNINVKDKGNADSVLLFLEKELIPYVNSTYKTANYTILAGHSVGGIFVTYAALTKPKLFNNFIAISPALWWENNALSTIASNTLKNNSNYKATVYISLADEKGMKVDDFLKKATNSLFTINTIYVIIFLFLLLSTYLYFRFKGLSKLKRIVFSSFILTIGILIALYLQFYYYPTDANFKFKKFSNENHNSVGIPTYKWALNTIFKTTQVEKKYFKNANDLKVYYNANKNKFSIDLDIPNGLLANTVFYILMDDEQELTKINHLITELYPNKIGYYNSLLLQLYLKNQQFKKAESLYKEVIKQVPNSVDLIKSYAEIKKEQHNIDIAKELTKKAIELADSQKLRQWRKNELIALEKSINKQ